jgi:hypothetical protein
MVPREAEEEEKKNEEESEMRSDIRQQMSKPCAWAMDSPRGAWPLRGTASPLP